MPPDEPVIEEPAELDEMSRLLNERYPAAETSPEEPPAEPEPVPEEVPTEVPVEVPPVSEFDLGDGKKVTADQARRYLEFEAFLEANPAYGEVLTGLLTNKYRAVPVEEEPVVPQSPQIPAEIDAEDPAVRFLLSRIDDQNARLTDALNRLNTHEAQLTATRNANAEVAIGTARESFQKDHDLTDEQMNKVYDQAKLVNLQAFPEMQAIDEKGLPRKTDPVGAMLRAFDMAYRSLDEFHDIEHERWLTTYQADQERKRKLNALGGTAGSISRTPREPSTPAERRQAMIDEVAAKMFNQ